MDKVAYDVEVLRGPDQVEGGWNNPWEMGFGTAVVFDFSKNLYLFYGPEQKTTLVYYLKSKKVISFNGVKFDNRVLIAPDSYIPDLDVPWSNVDLLIEVVRAKFGASSVEEAEEKYGRSDVHNGSIGLDGLSKGTLGMSKSGHGARAPELIREGKWAEVFAYNLHDVRLTVLLYDFAKTYGYLVDGDGRKIVIDRERL